MGLQLQGQTYKKRYSCYFRKRGKTNNPGKLLKVPIKKVGWSLKSENAHIHFFLFFYQILDSVLKAKVSRQTLLLIHGDKRHVKYVY